MVLDKLGNSLRNVLNKIARTMFVDEKLVDEIIKEIQRALLQADVNVELVFKLTKKIKERALKEEARGLTKKEQLINIVYEELVNFLGKEHEEIKITKKPTTLMLIGLFGSGKTTTAAKLAKFYKKRGYKVALLCLDVYRPAAYEQLKQLSNKVGVDFYGKEKEKNPLKIWNEFKEKISKYDIVIIDTAGRDALSEDLIKELNELNKAIKPEERLLVISADIGQAALNQAKSFHNAVNLTGIIVTRLDGTARAGGALTACAATDAKIKFIGVGEHVDDLEAYDAKRFVSRLLGMGDIQALLEKAREAVKEEEAKDIAEKFMSGKFDLLDLYNQMLAVKKMGKLSKLLSLVPGFGNLNLPKEMIDVQEEKMQKWKIAMDSMTLEELKNPEIINASRIKRISKGSGIDESNIRDLLKHYKQSKKVVKMLKPGNIKQMQKMMKKFGFGLKF